MAINPSCKIIVVDDSVDAAATLSALLSLLGHKVRICHRGADAVAAVHAEVPELVFLDIRLPDMSGIEVIRAIRKDARFNAVAFVVLSGFGSAQRRSDADDAGCDDFLMKPCSYEELVVVLDRYAERCGQKVVRPILVAPHA